LASKNLAQIKESAEKLQLGSLNKAIGGLSGALSALANPTTAAVVGFGALATASVGAAVGVVKLVAAADQWWEDLVKIGRADGLINKSQLQAIMDANGAMSELGIALKRIGVIVAADFAPAVARMVNGLADVIEASEGLAKSVSWVDAFIAVMGGSQVKTTLELWEGLARAMGLVQGVTSVPTPGHTPKGIGSGTMTEAAGAMVSPADLVKYLPKATTTGAPSKEASKIQEAMDRMGDELENVAMAEVDSRIKAHLDAVALHATTQAHLLEAQRATVALSGLQSAKFGMIYGMVAGATTALLNIDDTVRNAGNFLIELPEKLGKAIEGLLTKVIPRLIERLPRMIANALNLPFVIVEAIVNAVPQLVVALGNAIMRAISHLLDFFRGGEDRNVLTGRKGKLFGTSFKKGEVSFLGFGNNDDVGDDTSGRRRLDRAAGRMDDLRRNGRSRRSGGYIDRTGAYMLHAGERVVPPTGAGSSAASNAMRRHGSGPTVNVSVGSVIGGDVRELVRLIRRELGSYGTGANLTARG